MPSSPPACPGCRQTDGVKPIVGVIEHDLWDDSSDMHVNGTGLGCLVALVLVMLVIGAFVLSSGVRYGNVWMTVGGVGVMLLVLGVSIRCLVELAKPRPPRQPAESAGDRLSKAVERSTGIPEAVRRHIDDRGSKIIQACLVEGAWPFERQLLDATRRRPEDVHDPVEKRFYSLQYCPTCDKVFAPGEATLVAPEQLVMLLRADRPVDAPD
jgi:hypothetical protein